MKHFGNSLSYEEIMEDAKTVYKYPTYHGERTTVKRTGKYENGKFIHKAERGVVEAFTIYHNGKNWILSHDGDSGNFSTVGQAKRRATYVFGRGIKWKQLANK